MNDEFEDVDEETLDEFLMEKYEDDPLVQELIDEVMTRQWLREKIFSNNQDVQRQIGEIIEMISFVGYDELEVFLEQEDCKEIYEQVKSDFEDGERTVELIQTYHQNKQESLEKVNRLIEEVEQELYGSRYDDIQNLRDSNRDDVDEILNEIKDPIHSDPENKDILNRLKRLVFIRSKLLSFPYDEDDLTSELPVIGGDENRVLKHCAVQIYKPELYTSLYRYEDDFKEFPLRWLSHLPIYAIRRLYRAYQAGEIEEEAVKWEVNGNGYLDGLLDDLEKVPPMRERENILEEIVGNYKDERYASVINLAYPQIEHLMWIYAAFLDQEKGKDIIRNASYDEFWNFNPRDHSDLTLRNLNGESMESPHIRDLVENTALSKELTPAVVEFFVDELFEDRNPILHGNVADYASELEAAKKILILRNIAERLIDSLTSMVGDEAMELMED